MTFSKIKPIGWADGEILTNEQMNDLDTDHANAVDGVGGGTYTITAPLVIEGDQVTLGQGTDIVQIGEDENSTFACEASALFGADVTIAAGDLGVAGSISATANLTASGNCTLGNASGDAHTITGTTTINDPVVYALAGRPRFKTATLTDANANITPVTANIYYMPTGVMSAGRVLTISDTDCGNGDWLWVFSAEGTHGLTVNGPGGSPTYHTISSNTGDQCSLYLVRIGGTWRMVGLDYIN